MKATYVKPVKTPADPVLVSRSYSDAISFCTGIVPGPECVAVLHAHGAFETGHFEHCYNWNAGNIKATEGYIGLFTCIDLNEILSVNGKRIPHWFAPEGLLLNDAGISVPKSKGGKVKGQPLPVPDGHPYTRMRAHESLAKGLEGKVRFFLDPRWIHCLDYAHHGDPEGFVESIRDMGYFTADMGPYMRGVKLLYQKYLPVAKGLVSHPPSLPTHQEEELETCITQCARFDFNFTPDPNWDAVRADRDRDVQEDNQ